MLDVLVPYNWLYQYYLPLDNGAKKGGVSDNGEKKSGSSANDTTDGTLNAESKPNILKKLSML